jgi:ankyrin repeat protein
MVSRKKTRNIRKSRKVSKKTRKQRGGGIEELRYAIVKNDLNAVKDELEKDISILNSKDNKGYPPIIIAVSESRTHIVKFLLEKGADINMTNHDGITALIIASNRGYKDIVQLLLEKGADINKANNNGETPLYAASVKNYTQIVSILLDNGAEVDKPTSEGYTPLMMASNYGHLDTVKLLLEKGADPILENKRGITAYDVALMNRRSSIVKLFKKIIEKNKLVNKLNALNSTGRIIPAPAMREMASYMANLTTTNKNYITSRYATPNAERNAIPKPWYKTRKTRKKPVKHPVNINL